MSPESLRVIDVKYSVLHRSSEARTRLTKGITGYVVLMTITEACSKGFDPKRAGKWSTGE